MNNITLLSSNPQNRDITIDIAKGIAILLVVLGHLQNPINKYIYAFHMPLFFFLSGMFVKGLSFKDTIFQKGYRLLLPFIFYYLYAVLMKIGRLFFSGKFTIESLWFTNIDSVFYNIGPIWFLLSLFYIFVLWSLLSKYSIRIRYIIIALLLLIPYSSQGQNPLYFNSALLGLPFFCMGHDFKQYGIYNKFTKLKCEILLILGGGFCILSYSHLNIMRFLLTK